VVEDKTVEVLKPTLLLDIFIIQMLLIISITWNDFGAIVQKKRKIWKTRVHKCL